VLVCTVGVLYDEVVRTEIPDETAEGGNGHPIPRQWLVGLRKRGNDGCCVSFDLAPFSGTRVFLRWLVCADTSTMSACVQEKHVSSFRVRPPLQISLVCTRHPPWSRMAFSSGLDMDPGRTRIGYRHGR
jgi:hypothetical protein